MKFVRTISLCTVLLMVTVFTGWSQSAPAEAFENVTIHTAEGEVIEGGTMVWRDGVIRAVGDDVSIPFDAYVHDGGDSLHVYPGFIDGMALWGSPTDNANQGNPDEPGKPDFKRAGIQPHLHPSDRLKADDQALEKASMFGFTTAALGLQGQMLPGQVDLFFIDGKQTRDKLLEEGAGVLAKFEKAKGSAYPSTTMALMAQFRQLFYDAEAQMDQQEYFASVSSNYPAPKKEKVLEALYPVIKQEQPFYFVVDRKENIERLFWLQDELGFEVVLVSGKEAYKKAEEIQRRDIPVLASIDLPEKPDWMSADGEEKGNKKSQEVTDEMEDFRERQQKAYNEKIENIKRLKEAGVKVGYASNGLAISDIQKNLSILKGEVEMTELQILEMLTQSTADILSQGERLGDLKRGRLANFTVFDKPFTEEKAKGLYSISNGEVTELESD